MGAPVGNNNYRKGRPWTEAIHRALVRAEDAKDFRSLNALADKLLEKAADGDMSALRELGDRLEGKPAITVSGDPDAPLHLVAISGADIGV